VPWNPHLLHQGTECLWRETWFRLAMPEINRQLNLTKVVAAVQTGFSMAKSPPIEFDMVL
jgi:hypothetical protein